MAALAAVEAVNIMPEAALAGFEEYAPPLHRCELVRTLDGVEYINDSKATNLHALEAALRSQSRPTVLIAGGKEKELDYTPLLPALEGRVSRIVVFGEIRSRLVDTFSPAVRTVNAVSLKEAVQYAREASEPGGTVLFSPGTSSFDMFSGYEERGDAYRKIVHALK
jgi:UDP-N-acetylmuramoylalanine--D-glutamate ligase